MFNKMRLTGSLTQQAFGLATLDGELALLDGFEVGVAAGVVDGEVVAAIVQEDDGLDGTDELLVGRGCEA